MTPGAKFSSSTSAFVAIRFRISRPCSDFRLSDTPFLFEFSMAKGKVADFATLALRRAGSPDGGSTLMTVAPALAISSVA